ncbi:MAG: bactofilin family protein [Anaerolineae bacterium]
MGWFRKRRSSKVEARAENVFAAGTLVKGNVKAQGSVCIEGEFEGDLTTDGNIVVGKSAEVRAKLAGRSVVVSGVVHGDIRADGRLEILASGRVWGDVQVGSLEIAEGGLLRGVCEMLTEGEDVGAGQAKQTATAADSGGSSGER